MRTRRGWLLTLGPIGSAALLYAVVVRGFVEPDAGHSLAWPLLGALPIFVFGLWLISATTSRAAIYVALAATGTAVGSAYETFLLRNPDVMRAEAFPLINVIGLTAEAVAAVGMLVMIAGFPTGVAEHRWQRVVVRFIWTAALVGPLTLLTTPVVVMSPYITMSSGSIPNPYAVTALEWAAPFVEALIHQPWPAVALGLGTFYYRAIFGDPETRARMRVMSGVTTAAVGSWVLWTILPGFWPFQAAVFASMLALPIAVVHGILRFGAFDVAPSDRGPLVVRSSTMIITVIYGTAVATPAVLLSDRLTPISAVVLTTALAVCLLPVRGWLHRWIARVVLGDRDRQLTLLSELGAQLERAVEPDELLARLAQAVHDGLDASWVRIRLVGPDGQLSESA